MGWFLWCLSQPHILYDSSALQIQWWCLQGCDDFSQFLFHSSNLNCTFPIVFAENFMVCYCYDLVLPKISMTFPNKSWKRLKSQIYSAVCYRMRLMWFTTHYSTWKTVVLHFTCISRGLLWDWHHYVRHSDVLMFFLNDHSYSESFSSNLYLVACISVFAKRQKR